MCNGVMDFWNEVFDKNYILMRKEFDKNNLLLEKEEKQM